LLALPPQEVVVPAALKVALADLMVETKVEQEGQTARLDPVWSQPCSAVALAEMLDLQTWDGIMAVAAVVSTAVAVALPLSKALLCLAVAVMAVAVAVAVALLAKARALLAVAVPVVHFTSCLFKEKNGKNFCSYKKRHCRKCRSR
jgi:hypothetical protein